MLVLWFLHVPWTGDVSAHVPCMWHALSSHPTFTPTQASQTLDLGYWFRIEVFSASLLRLPCHYTLVLWGISPHGPHLEPLSIGMFSSVHQNSVSFCFHLASLYLLILLYCVHPPYNCLYTQSAHACRHSNTLTLCSSNAKWLVFPDYISQAIFACLLTSFKI